MNQKYLRKIKLTAGSIMAILLLWTIVAQFVEYPEQASLLKQVELSHLFSKSHQSKLRSTIILAGDAGEPVLEKPDPTLALIAKFLNNGQSNLALFMGDNVYNSGLPDPQLSPELYKEAVPKLEAQMKVMASDNPNSKLIFVPGNHDWDRSGPLGLYYIKYTSAFIKNHELNVNQNIFQYPTAGEPGPHILDWQNTFRFIFIDSEWFKRGIYSKTERDPKLFQKELAQTLHEAKAKQLDSMLVMHHPFHSLGIHGGHYNWREMVRPPIYGLARLIHRMTRVSGSDAVSKSYADLRQAIYAGFGKNPPVGMLAGHEHGLQLLQPKQKNYFQMVSGSGAGTGKKITPIVSYASHSDGILADISNWYHQVTENPNFSKPQPVLLKSHYSKATLGFFIFQIMQDNSIEVYAISRQKDGSYQAWAMDYLKLALNSQRHAKVPAKF